MEQLIYASEGREGLGSEEVFSIIQTSSRRNPEREVTGFLILRAGKFFQLVEGPSAQLDRLLSDLEADDRHHSLVVIERRPISARSFPHWLMKRVRPGYDLAEMQEIVGVLEKEENTSTIMQYIERFAEKSN